MLSSLRKIIYSLLIKESKEPTLIDLERLNLIVSNKAKLLDMEFLENELIPGLGLNNELLNEFPSHLYPFCGQGLFIWQYPNQLAKYLKFISGYKINSYLEIGVRHGGMFLLTKTFLETLNNAKVHCVGIDLEKNGILKKKAKLLGYKYFVNSSSSRFFKREIKNEHFDLALIDGDHSFVACLSDFELIKDKSNIIVFHDIVSDVCPGVVRVWNGVKKDSNFKTFEITDQYEEVIQREGKKYLGIGIAVKSHLIN